MPNDTGLSADHYIVTDLGAAAYAGLRCDHGIVPYFNVMRHLYQVIEFGARFNYGRTDGCAVDGCIGADLYKILHHYITNLRNFFEAAIGLRSKTKSIAADNGACMY